MSTPTSDTGHVIANVGKRSRVTRVTLDRVPRLKAGVAVTMMTLLAACQERTTDTKVLAKVEAAQNDAAAEDGRVKCALAGSDAFQRVCTIDRETGTRGLVLTVHHPDGGFRRLLVTKDGRGVAAADGAEPAKVAIVDANEIEVALGDDLYRLPATVKR